MVSRRLQLGRFEDSAWSLTLVPHLDGDSPQQLLSAWVDNEKNAGLVLLNETL
jgi:hypothetical protein